MFRSKLLVAGAITGLFAGGYFGIGGAPDGVTAVAAADAEAIQGGTCWSYDYSTRDDRAGCSGVAKSMPTTTNCVKTQSLTWVPYFGHNYGENTPGTCYECGNPCGGRDNFVACAN